MQTNGSKFSRRYDREFKQNAVALIQSGRSITEVSRDLGVSGWSYRLLLIKLRSLSKIAIDLQRQTIVALSDWYQGSENLLARLGFPSGKF